MPSNGKQPHGFAYLLHVPHSPLHSQWLLRSLVCSAGKQQSSLLPLLLPLLLLLLPLHWLVAELVSLWMLAAGSEQHQASLRLSETGILLACHQILYHPAGKTSRRETASLGSSPLRSAKRQWYKETKLGCVKILHFDLTSTATLLWTVSLLLICDGGAHVPLRNLFGE